MDLDLRSFYDNISVMVVLVRSEKLQNSYCTNACKNDTENAAMQFLGFLTVQIQVF